MRDVAVSPAPAARKRSDRRARFDFGRNARFFNSRASSPPSIARRPIPAFPPVSREPNCFPESAPGSARHAYRGLNTHLDLGRLEGRDGAGESGGNAGHFCSCFFVLKEGECAGMARGIEDTPLYTAGIKIFWEDRGIGRWSGQFRVPGCRVKSPMLDQMPIPNLCSISPPGSYFHKTGIRRANRNGRWIEASLRFGKSGIRRLFLRLDNHRAISRQR